MSEDVPACPECNSANAFKNVGGFQSRGSDHDWRCNRCKAKFDEPVYRPRRPDGDGLVGLAQRLHEATPEDVGLSPRGERA